MEREALPWRPRNVGKSRSPLGPCVYCEHHRAVCPTSPLRLLLGPRYVNPDSLPLLASHSFLTLVPILLKRTQWYLTDHDRDNVPRQSTARFVFVVLSSPPSYVLLFYQQLSPREYECEGVQGKHWEASTSCRVRSEEIPPLQDEGENALLLCHCHLALRSLDFANPSGELNQERPGGSTGLAAAAYLAGRGSSHPRKGKARHTPVSVCVCHRVGVRVLADVCHFYPPFRLTWS